MKKILLLFLLAAVSLQSWADEYYLVGGCTDSGWNEGEWQRSAVRAYTADGTTWVWAGKLTTGEGDAGRFKIPNGTSEWHAGYWAPSQGTMLTSEWSGMDDNGDSNDYKWCVSEEGYYLITFKTDTKQIKAEKLTAPSMDGDYYKISNVDEYYWFAAYIATDDTKNAKARLTANLSFQEKTFVPMASDKHKFKGEFDGNGHTIDYAVVQASSYGKIGLFTYLTGEAYIHDLIMGENCSFTGTLKVGGISGYARDGGEVTLTNVINKASVRATGSTDANAAGLIACATDNTIITALNCANTGNVSGQAGECAALAGWTQDRTVNNVTTKTTFTNCWNSGEINNIESTAQLYRNSGKVTATNCYDLTETGDQGTRLDAGAAASGELCYRLNASASGGTNWYQTLGTDNHPVPFNTSKKIYKNLSSEYVNIDSPVQIGNATALANFAAIVNDGGTSLNAEVTANITANADFTPIGTSTYMYKGTFDGKGKSIKLSINNTSSSVNHRALIGYATGGATIQNLILTGSVESSGNVTAGFIAETYGGGTVTITNCGNEAAISGGAGETAAIIANNNGASKCTLHLTNVYNIGSVSGTANVSSICASVGEGSHIFSNIYNAKTPTTSSNTSGALAIFARTTFWQSNSFGTYTRCYSIEKNTEDNSDILTFSESDKTSGKLCFKLNNDETDVWKQKIGGTRKYPNFEDTEIVNQVVADESYTNLTNISGDKVQLSTPDDLLQFANEVNAGNTAMNAEQTADIDFSMHSAAGVMIGNTSSFAYSGIYDGQTHNIEISYDIATKNVGLFRYLSNATIKNLCTTGTIKNSASCSGGIFAGTNDANNESSLVENCISSVTFDRGTTGGDATFGGIGAYMHGSGKIKNCAFLGSISAKNAAGNGGILGYANGGSDVKVQNCYVKASSIDVADDDNNKVIVRNTTPENCYFVEREDLRTQTGATQVTAEEVTSGKLCYRLNGTEPQTIKWYQIIAGPDTHPYPFGTHKQVYKYSDDIYTNLPVKSDKVQISNADDLNTFAAEVNSGKNRSMDAELTNDIDYSVYTNQAAMIGKEGKTYKGTFDGQFHTVTVAFNNTSADETGLVQRMNGGTIKNLRVDGTISTDKKLAAGICSGIWQTGTITNCWSNVTITDDGTGDATHGGIVAHVKDNTNVNITHCLFSGKINASERTGSGALVGWADSENDNIKINHCLVVGEVNLKSGVDNDIICRRNATTSGNYYTCDITALTNNRKATVATSGQKTSGELCYLLNSSSCYGANWFQNLSSSVDSYPVPFNTHGIVNKMSAAGYTTQYIPGTDVTIPDGVEAYTGVILSEGWLHLNAIENGKIAAGEAVILKGNEGYYSFVPTTDAEEVEGNVLKGSDGTITGGDGIYALAKKGNPAVVGFYSVNSDVPVPAGKVYLDSDGSLVKVFKFVFDDDDETGLNSPLLTSPEEEGQVYNLAGQRISKLQRGINIINGKKVLK